MDEQRITFQVTKQEKHMLLQLLATGLYGLTIGDTVERIIAEALEERVLSGAVDEPKEEGRS